MTKREKKIQLIDDYFKCCFTNSSYTYGSIPEKKTESARREYAGNVASQDVYGLYCEDILSSGSKGVLLTDKGLYYNLKNEKGFLSYEKYFITKKIPCIVLDSPQIKEDNLDFLIGKLAEVDQRMDWEEFIDSGKKGLQGMKKGLEQVDELITDALEWKDAFMNTAKSFWGTGDEMEYDRKEDRDFISTRKTDE